MKKGWLNNDIIGSSLLFVKDKSIYPKEGGFSLGIVYESYYLLLISNFFKNKNNNCHRITGIRIGGISPSDN